MDKIAALKKDHPHLFNFIAGTVDPETPEGIEALTAAADRTALVVELSTLGEYPVMPIGSKGRTLLDAKKDGLLQKIVEQEAILAKYGLV